MAHPCSPDRAAVGGSERIGNDFLGQLQVAGEQVRKTEHGAAFGREQRGEGVVALPRFALVRFLYRHPAPRRHRCGVHTMMDAWEARKVGSQ